MLLYLLRHADAATEAAHDDDRTLSEKGLEQARRVAQFCRSHDVLPGLILTSPLPRAKQTAEPVALALKCELKTVPWLASGMTPQTAVEELKAYRGQTSLMITGHEPDFSALVAHLMGLPSNTLLHLRKGSLTAVQLDVLRAGAGRLEYSVPCRFMS